MLRLSSIALRREPLYSLDALYYAVRSSNLRGSAKNNSLQDPAKGKLKQRRVNGVYREATMALLFPVPWQGYGDVQ